MEHDEMIAQLDDFIRRVDNIKARYIQFIDFIAAMNTERDLIFWQALRKGDESFGETKKRFFLGLPKATGNLRVLQQALKILLVKLDKVCRENNISYFLGAGTLLGANRHKGFVPWDDDADVFMLRNEVDKLEQAMKDDKEFSLRIFADSSHNNNQYIRIVRFAFNDERLNNWQAFIDIFLLDWAKDASDESWDKYLDVRKRICGEFMEKRNEKQEHEDIISTFNTKYSDIFNSTVNPGDSKNALCWGWDNFTHGSKYMHEFEAVFPLTEVEFENHKFYAPNNPERYSAWRYGDWLSLPRRLNVDAFTHTKFSKTTINVLKELIIKYGDKEEE